MVVRRLYAAWTQPVTPASPHPCALHHLPPLNLLYRQHLQSATTHTSVDLSKLGLTVLVLFHVLSYLTRSTLLPQAYGSREF